MKALKIIGIIVAVLIAAILIIPLFSPATVEVSSNIEIALEPAQIFPSVASFEGRTAWDPWLTNDSTASADIESKPGYVGSTYAWQGEAVGTGRMEVKSVKENAYIESNLWFGPAPDPALVEWVFEQVDGGTSVTWSFAQETAYPFGRLGMMIGKGFLKKAFDEGLANLKEVMEANPPQVGGMGEISIATQPAMEVLVAQGGGTMEEMAAMMTELYTKVFTAAGQQGLQPAGPAFVHYLNYDESTGYSDFVAGVPVNGKGKDQGDVMAKSYEEMEVVQGLLTGSYDELGAAYGKLMEYVAQNGIEVGETAFEFYKVSAQDNPDPQMWKTLIAFPLL